MRQLQTRIDLNYRPLSRLSMVMFRSYTGHRYILYSIDEVTNCLITVPIHQSRSEEIDYALMCYAVLDKIGLKSYHCTNYK